MELKKNQTVNLEAVLTEVTEKQTSTGKTFCDVMLLTKDHERIPAKMWDVSVRRLENEGIAIPSVVLASILVEEYRGTLSPIVKELHKSSVNEPRDFLKPAYPETDEEDLLAFCKQLQPEEEVLVRQTFADYPAFFTIGAGSRVHDTYGGGLLHHTLEVTHMAASLADLYPELDRNVILTGALLHDIGKVKELTTDELGLATDYTLTGTLIGHPALSIQIVMEEAKKAASNFGKRPEELEKLPHILHILASHPGTLEHGALKPPVTREAEIVHMADELCARLSYMKEQEQGVLEGEVSTSYSGILSGRLYHPRREQTAETNAVPMDDVLMNSTPGTPVESVEMPEMQAEPEASKEPESPMNESESYDGPLTIGAFAEFHKKPATIASLHAFFEKNVVDGKPVNAQAEKLLELSREAILEGLADPDHAKQAVALQELLSQI